MDLSIALARNKIDAVLSRLAWLFGVVEIQIHP